MLPNETPIESWKEIGAYLQRDATTARRWEREEGLPVHRHSHKSRSSVYAYASEIDSWRVSRKSVAEPSPSRSLWRVPAFAVTMLACLIMVGNGIRPQVASAQQRRTLAKRLLCADCGDSENDFSSDGRSMVLTDWATGDLAIRDMSSGKVKRLMLKTGTWKDSDDYAEKPVFSPDLRQIAYLWYTSNPPHAQLRIMPNEPAGKPRVLVDNPEFTYYTAAGWSPDGKSVLVTVDKPDKTNQLVRVSVSDGAVKPIKSLEWRLAGINPRPRFSPDGRYIVYSARAVNPSKVPPAATDPKDQHIYVLAADGSAETEIVKTAGLNQSPVWTLDGKHILFTSDRSGKVDLWSIAIENGKAISSASLVSQGIENIGALGMRGGSYYYTQEQPGSEYINIVEMAPGGNAQGRTARSTDTFVGIRPTWSPDGKSIAFKRHHPGDTGYDLVVHSLETGDERTYRTTLGTSGPGAPVWSHDGKSILTGTGGSPYRIDVRTGEFEKLPGGGYPSPDDKTLYGVGRDPKDPDNGPSRIMAVDLSAGQEKLLFTMPEPGAANLLVNPDGRTLVVRWLDQKSRTTHFGRINIDGTGYREIYAAGQKDQAGALVWIGAMTLSKDGRWLLFEVSHDDKYRLMRLPIEGGTPEFIGVELDGTLGVNQRTIDLSPDGSRIAITTAKRVQELWALDNALSALK